MKCGRKWTFLKNLRDLEKLMVEQLSEALFSQLYEVDPIYGLIIGAK